MPDLFPRTITSEELIGFIKSTEEIRVHIGADSLAYLSEEGMMRAVTEETSGRNGHCNACFTGDYPIELNGYWRDRDKLAFQSAWAQSGDAE